VENPNHGKRLSFIITEGDIDREFDLLLEKWEEPSRFSGAFDALKDRRSLGDRETPAPEDADAPSSKDGGEEKSVSKKKETDEESIQKLQSYVDDNQGFHGEVLSVLSGAKDIDDVRNMGDIDDIVFLAKEIPGLPPLPALQEGGDTLGQELNKWIKQNRCGHGARQLYQRLEPAKKYIAHELSKVEQHKRLEKDPATQKEHVAQALLSFSNLFKGALRILKCSKKKPPEEEDCTGGRKKNDEGDCKCPPGYHWVPAGGAPEATTDEPDRKPFRTLEEVDAAPTGEGEVIPPDAEGECVKDEKDPCPEDQERNEDGECVDKEPQEKVDAEIEVFGWSEGSGGVTLVGGPKYKGGLPADEWSNLFAPQTSAYIDMFITYIFALSVIKKGNVIALDETRGVSVDDFYKKVVISAIERHKPELITTLGTLTLAVGPAPTKMAGEEGYVDQQLNLHRQYIDKDKIKEVQEAYKNIGEKLKKEKKMLESKPGLAAKFNALRKQHHKPLKDELLKELIGKINGFIEKLTQSASKDEESTLQEGKIVEISIDFKELRSKQLDESFLLMFGTWVKWILQSMFGTGHIPGKIKGTKREIESFARTMGSEKKYIETARRFGLDHPTTYKNKAKLDAASRSFEKTTGIKWPFE